MNRSWTPTNGVEPSGGGFTKKSKSTAKAAVEKSVLAKRGAATTEAAKFKQSYVNTSPSVPYSGFSPVICAQRRDAPKLSAATKARLGLVGAGYDTQGASAQDLQGGSTTGATVTSWQGLAANLFSPNRRGPVTVYPDDDLLKRHFVDDIRDDVSEAESQAAGDFVEFEAFTNGATDEEVLICSEGSFQSFRIQNVENEDESRTESHVSSMEDLVRLLACIGEPTLDLNKIQHLVLNETEVPLWALSLLFGQRGDLPHNLAKGTSPGQTPVQQEKPVAGSAAAAASAILSFRVSQDELQNATTEEEIRNASVSRVSRSLQEYLRNQLVSLDLSDGSLEPRYAPFRKLPLEARSGFKLSQALYDTNATQRSSPSTTKTDGRINSPAPEEEDEQFDEVFASEATTLSAGLLLLRDALQPKKILIPINEAETEEKIRTIEHALLSRLGREKREQRAAERRGGDQDGDDEAGLSTANEELVEAELRLENVEEELGNYPAPGQDPLEDGETDNAVVTDELYEEQMSNIRRGLHKWIDVPPVLPRLQALSLNDNPSLFLDPSAVFAEGGGSLETISEPNIPALEALKTTLQLSGAAQKHRADYFHFNALKARESDDESSSRTPLRGEVSHERYQKNRLATLLVANCGLNNSTALRYLAEGLAENTSLKKLSLARNHFARDSDAFEMEVFEEFSKAIGAHKTLEALDLSENDLTGEMCRMLAEAIEKSHESHLKDGEDDGQNADQSGEEGEDEDDDAAPEPPAGNKTDAFKEMFEDVIPPEEDPPSVTVGFPEEEERVGGADGEDDHYNDGADEAEENEEREEEAENEDDDEEEGMTGGRPPRPKKIAQKANHDMDDAEEDDEESSEAAAIRHAKALREAEREWRQKHHKFVSIPERILLNHAESTARRSLALEYHAELVAMKSAEAREARTCQRDEKSRREKEIQREERGWTHLQIIKLAGNPVGDVGASALASMLRHTVPMSEDDQARELEDREKELARLRKKLILEKKTEIRRNRLEEKELAKDALLKARAAADDDDGSPPSGALTSRPEIPQLAVPPRRASAEEEEDEDEDGDGEDNEGGDNEANVEEEEEEEEEIEIDESTLALPSLSPVKDVRPGVRSVYHLDLSDCRIGSRGVSALCEVLGNNCESLKTLNLSRNPFGSRPKRRDEASGADEGDDTRPAREDDAEYVPQCVGALCKGLSLNTHLVSLDLSFCKLYPASIAKLSVAFTTNRTLKHLNLRGNFIGHGRSLASGGSSSAFSMLLGAFVDETNGPASLETLILDQNGLGSTPAGSVFNQESVNVLATLCHSSLDTLSLAGNDLTDDDMCAFSNALYATAMNKKTGMSLDGSMSGSAGMSGRRGSITDMTDEELQSAAMGTESDDDDEVGEERMLGAQPRMRQAGTSFCVNTSATLRTFIVDNNPLLKGEAAGTSIARVIQFCSRLHFLSIGGCVGVGDSGFRLLCLKVGSHPSLSIFSGPRIGITSLSPLTQALQSGSAPLVALDFSDNDISKESLQEFSDAVCSMVTEALGVPSTSSHRASSPDVDNNPCTRGEAPPVMDSDDEDGDDCPPPPYDPDEEDVTPAQSMQRQASRMAILAASTSRSPIPNASNTPPKKRPMLRYVSFWGRRGASTRDVLMPIEAMIMNGLVEDYSCGNVPTQLLSGPTCALFDPLLNRSTCAGTLVLGQIVSPSYFLHRCVFDGAYGAAIANLTATIAGLRDREASTASISEAEQKLNDLKKEVLSFQKRFGFCGSSQSLAGLTPLIPSEDASAHVLSIPLVNTLRHQLIHALACEMRIKSRGDFRMLNFEEDPPMLDDDEKGRDRIEKLISGVRSACRVEKRRMLLNEKLSSLRSLRDLLVNAEQTAKEGDDGDDAHEDQFPSNGESEGAMDGGEGGSPNQDAARDSRYYGKLIRQLERQLANEEEGGGGKANKTAPRANTSSLLVTGSPTLSTSGSPSRRTTREHAFEVASKQLALTDGGLLLLLAESDHTTSATYAKTGEDASADRMRMMRWQSLLNRLASK